MPADRRSLFRQGTSDDWTRIVIRLREGLLVGECYPLRKPRATYEAVLRADPCAYCGHAAGTLDHIEPRSRGGRDLIENLTSACERCNNAKSSQSLLAYLGGLVVSATTNPDGGRPRITRELRQAERESIAPKTRKRSRWDGIR